MMNTIAKTPPLVRWARWLASAVLLAFVSVGSVQAQGFGPLLPEDVLISTTSSPLGPVRVAFDGSRYLVVWAQAPEGDGASDVYGRFVDAAGVLAGEPFQIFTSPFDDLQPAVAFNGSDYLVVWRNPVGIFTRIVGTHDGALSSILLVA